MADNYLEKRMEEYRAGKLTSKGGKTYVARQRKAGEFMLAFPPMSVLCALRGCRPRQPCVRLFPESGFPGGFLYDRPT